MHNMEGLKAWGLACLGVELMHRGGDDQRLRRLLAKLVCQAKVLLLMPQGESWRVAAICHGCSLQVTTQVP